MTDPTARSARAPRCGLVLVRARSAGDDGGARACPTAEATAAIRERAGLPRRPRTASSCAGSEERTEAERDPDGDGAESGDEHHHADDEDRAVGGDARGQGRRGAPARAGAIGDSPIATAASSSEPSTIAPSAPTTPVTHVVERRSGAEGAQHLEVGVGRPHLPGDRLRGDRQRGHRRDRTEHAERDRLRSDRSTRPSRR